MMAIGDRQMLGSWISRGVGYFALWVLLIGFKPVDLLVGLVAVAAATWTSLALLPPRSFACVWPACRATVCTLRGNRLSPE